jgi:hypothetical protein
MLAVDPGYAQRDSVFQDDIEAIRDRLIRVRDRMRAQIRCGSSYHKVVTAPGLPDYWRYVGGCGDLATGAENIDFRQWQDAPSTRPSDDFIAVLRAGVEGYRIGLELKMGIPELERFIRRLDAMGSFHIDRADADAVVDGRLQIVLSGAFPDPQGVKLTLPDRGWWGGILCNLVYVPARIEEASRSSIRISVAPQKVGTFCLINLGHYDGKSFRFTRLSNPGVVIVPSLGEEETGTQIWVDFAFTGIELGTSAQAFNTVAEALSAAPDGGTIIFKPGVRRETLTIDKRLSLQSSGGPVTIGRQ